MLRIPVEILGCVVVRLSPVCMIPIDRARGRCQLQLELEVGGCRWEVVLVSRSATFAVKSRIGPANGKPGSAHHGVAGDWCRLSQTHSLCSECSGITCILIARLGEVLPPNLHAYGVGTEFTSYFSARQAKFPRVIHSYKIRLAEFPATRKLESIVSTCSETVDKVNLR